MDIIQTFYDNLASDYDKLFLDWEATTCEQADILHKLFTSNGYDTTAHILDCSCGIGTQSIGLARLGYNITASDISIKAIEEAKLRAEKENASIRFENADFRTLSDTFEEKFDIVISMDNALPHMLSSEDLERAIISITNQIKDNGVFLGSIRDYDALLDSKPTYSPPYIHKTDDGQRVCFQTWEWNDDCYKLIQYIIEDNKELEVKKFECEYRATRRDEITKLFTSCGCSSVKWLFPDETKFYQPIVIAIK